MKPVNAAGYMGLVGTLMAGVSALYLPSVLQNNSRKGLDKAMRSYAVHEVFRAELVYKIQDQPIKIIDTTF